MSVLKYCRPTQVTSFFLDYSREMYILRCRERDGWLRITFCTSRDRHSDFCTSRDRHSDLWGLRREEMGCREWPEEGERGGTPLIMEYCFTGNSLWIIVHPILHAPYHTEVAPIAIGIWESKKLIAQVHVHVPHLSYVLYLFTYQQNGVQWTFLHAHMLYLHAHVYAHSLSGPWKR